ncbi:hypothetical protein BDQ94DRAFT_164641 [Aspergillus welwitschiae]|uniref:Uncharacterized protein n=1 Tax=Aspergillus welwitschiae TaxID=1341132 RepID=A0A3F3PH32_9EURO|nr:hypothetical protein BDQ94DRAFT_164641 [Aspergillus welwitschiae]RDH26251.1 hypothetical protein BDQ94DRAFT_164641 [Aspergillus welwitschiae]
MTNLQCSDETFPCDYGALAFDCYSSSYEVPDAPYGRPKNTLESVTVSPFFLPRVKCDLDNLGHCRKQIWEVLRPYKRIVDHADY